MLLSAGSNAHGQLSNGSLDDSHSFAPCSFFGSVLGVVPGGGRLVHLASGANHTLALLELSDAAGNVKTELWGCGDGNSGQLGPSYTDEGMTIFRPLDLALERNGLHGYHPRLVCTSWETTYVVLSSPEMPDVLISMGANDFGDLGIGSKQAGKLPAKDFHIVRFDHLGVPIHDNPVDSRSLLVEWLASGQHHVVANLKTASGDWVVGWGTSRHGQLGNVDKPFLSSPVIISPAQSDDATISAALGHQHTVFLHASGTVSAFGSNRKRQLEGVDGTAHTRSVDCTWNGTYITVGAGQGWNLLSVGNNANGQLGRDEDAHPSPVTFPFTAATHRLLKVACGSEHVLASFVVGTSSTEVWGWGWNEHGNLGIGTTEDVRSPVRIWPPQSSQAPPSGNIDIWAGSGTSWIVIHSIQFIRNTESHWKERNLGVTKLPELFLEAFDLGLQGSYAGFLVLHSGLARWSGLMRKPLHFG
ncbi:regulator of chromosome condensation 1/beta-lactamase-inhibitor protein II [Mycena maculata]|uniref:Regulator of chromosome condensation 1/beta-lactamase-inhibitor protein II n=1 Tax=Mycena maculata TaxID=230809 RepID=A0AAD7JDU7_9AGAR|nr:regulator of chromosome condensation 1/beta-lactamase-inhibitor protein II [Mycena maculata]